MNIDRWAERTKRDEKKRLMMGLIEDNRIKSILNFTKHEDTEKTRISNWGVEG